MIKPLTVDLALPLYAELPNYEALTPEIEGDFESSTGPDAQSGGLEISLQKQLPGVDGEEIKTLFVRG